MTGNPATLVTGITGSMALLPFLYLICHLGEIVTNAYFNLNSSIYNVSWYLCPVEIQKCILPMLLAAEQPIYFNSIASLNCSHDTFKRVKLRHLFSKNLNQIIMQ